MRRTGLLALGTVVLVGLALAAPGARNAVSRTLRGTTDEARRRLAAFRADMARREAELRAGLLPADADVDSARARRADADSHRARGADADGARADTDADGAHAYAAPADQRAKHP